MNNYLDIKKKASELAFMITTATVLQLLYWVFGMGEFSLVVMAKVWILGLGMAMAVYGLHRWLKVRYLGIAVVLGLLVFTGKWHVGLWLVWAIAIGGLVQFVVDMRGKPALVEGDGVEKKGSGLWFLGSVLVVLIMGLGVNWLINYNYEFLLERGWTHIDSIWHSSISSMYKQYGVCSLGIDGLNPITYHTLMHKTMAGLSICSNLPVIQVYALFYGVWAPILVLAAMIELAKKTTDSLQKSALVKSYQTWEVGKVGAGVWWTVAGILYMVFFRLFVFRGLNLGEEMIMSESYFMGLLFMIFAFSTYLEYQKTGQFYLIVLVGMWLLITSITKSNLGVLAYGTMGFILVFGHIKDIRFWLAYLASSAGFAATMLKVVQQASKQTESISPQWGFAITVKEYSNLLNYLPIPIFAVKVLVHFLLFYLPVWILVWRYKRIFGATWYKQKPIWMVGTFLVPSLLVNYVVCLGFNSFYFTNPVNFLAVIFLLVPAVKWVSGAAEFNWKKWTFPKAPMSIMILFILAVYSMLDLRRMGNSSNPNNYYYCRKEMVKQPPKPAMVAWVKRANALQRLADSQTVLEYQGDSMVAMGYPALGSVFLVPGITEMVTVGHVPDAFFFTYGDYLGVKYPLVLPANSKQVKF